MGSLTGLLCDYLAGPHISDLWGVVMKLLELLVNELPELGGIPDNAMWIHQSKYDGELYFYDEASNLMRDFRGLMMSKMSEDSPEITREEYLSAIANKSECDNA